MIWGFFPVVSRLGLEHSLSAFDITAVRYLVAGAILLPVLLRRGSGGLPMLAVLLLAAGAGAPYLMFATGGLVFAPAAHFGVVAPGSMMLFSAAGSAWLFGDRFDVRRLAGMSIIIAGILCMGAHGLADTGEWTWLGDLLFLAAGFFWSVYTLSNRYFKVEPLHSIAIVSVLSMLFYTPPYFFVNGAALFSANRGEVLLQAVYQGVLSAFVALWLYTRAVMILGPARGALFAALVPGFALLFAIPVLGERPDVLEMIGVMLVTGGMVFALGRGRADEIKTDELSASRASEDEER